MLGCDGASRKAPPAPAPPVSGAVTSARGGAAAAASPATAPPDACRVMSVSGRARRGSGQPIARGARLAGAEPIELEDDGRLHFKHTGSGREWTARGPARLVPCVDGQEEIILVSGALRAELGAGARPGAEVWVGTPFGSIRYARAQAEVRVSEQALELTASVGDVWLEGAAPAAELRVAAAIRRPAAQRLRVGPALEACARAAAESEARAKALLGPGEVGLGQRAAAHVRARRLARSRCASATATVLAQAPSDELAARLRELEEYRRAWQRVPASKT